jgi:hypothetical protein
LPLEKENVLMLDLLCVGLTILFFAVAVLLVRGCEALEGEED